MIMTGHGHFWDGGRAARVQAVAALALGAAVLALGVLAALTEFPRGLTVLDSPLAAILACTSSILASISALEHRVAMCRIPRRTCGQGWPVAPDTPARRGTPTRG
jgi:heme A synthase